MARADLVREHLPQHEEGTAGLHLPTLHNGKAQRHNSVQGEQKGPQYNVAGNLQTSPVVILIKSALPC